MAERVPRAREAAPGLSSFKPSPGDAKEETPVDANDGRANETKTEKAASVARDKGAPRRRRSRSRRKPNRRRSGRSAPTVERFMLVHDDPEGIQIAVLEESNGGRRAANVAAPPYQIVEHYVTREEDRSIVGNVYLGRVQNVLPGMEASFVDINESRNGVLYAGEVGIAGEEGDEVPRIETVLKSGQPIMVQVTKDPMRAKGARLTAMVSLAGRHLVLVPNAKSIGVSRRLSDAERSRLRDIAQKIRPDDHGLIIRTAAEGANHSDLERDLERVLEIYKAISDKAKGAKAPALLYEEPEFELRVIRDLFNHEVTRCVVEGAQLESKLRDYIRVTTPSLDHRLELYDGGLPIFEEYRVVEQIRKSLERRVWLPSGGHIVIDRTEAMTVIDVNTGKFVGKSNLEETVFKTNKESAIEVARQLRLRDIGGIIVIDFIDMEESENRDEVIRVFRKELEHDRSRTQVFDISPLGLVQMTRKSVSTGIVDAFSDPCPTCEGRGILVHDVD